ncbi:MAG TPA: hypothetical protein VHK90_10690 [Thermoanaerobaculia bacterium]|nr:hypothetical protein [Thermoanaerobaculia bacterium]
MKRNVAVLLSLVLLFTVAACAVNTPGTAGVITKVDAGTVTVAQGGTETTYTLGRNTNIYATDGNLTQRAYLSPGQRVLVWANGTNAVRINVEP